MSEEQNTENMLDTEFQDFTVEGNVEKKESTVKKKPLRKKESIEDIINAVAQKEDVITSFKGKKKALPSEKQNFAYTTDYLRTPEGSAEILHDIYDKLNSGSLLKMSVFFAKPWKYLLLQFFGGVFFVCGVAVVVLVLALLALKFKEVAVIGTMFNKLVYLMKALK